MIAGTYATCHVLRHESHLKKARVEQGSNKQNDLLKNKRTTCRDSPANQRGADPGRGVDRSIDYRMTDRDVQRCKALSRIFAATQRES